MKKSTPAAAAAFRGIAENILGSGDKKGCEANARTNKRKAKAPKIAGLTIKVQEEMQKLLAVESDVPMNPARKGLTMKVKEEMDKLHLPSENDISILPSSSPSKPGRRPQKTVAGVDDNAAGLTRLVEASRITEEGTAMSAPVIRKGDKALFQLDSGEKREVDVTGVDYSAFPPTYMVRLNGVEHATSREKLTVAPHGGERRSVGSMASASGTTKMKLDVIVVGARHLPDLDNLKKSLNGLPDNFVGLGHPLCIKLRYLDKVVRTTNRWDERNPDWNEKFPFGLAMSQWDAELNQPVQDEEEDENLEVELIDHVDGRDSVLASCVVSAEKLRNVAVETEGEEAGDFPTQMTEMTLTLKNRRGRALRGADGAKAEVLLGLRRRLFKTSGRCGSRSSRASTA